MSIFSKIKLLAIDTDGVLFNDTYSPVIYEYVTSKGVEYTPELERHVWGSPQIAAGQYMALKCNLPISANEVMNEFFQLRESFLKKNPVSLIPGTIETIEMFAQSGLRLTTYGGRGKEYSFDKFLSSIEKYVDRAVPYIDVNPIRPGVKEIVTNIFNYDYDEVIFIDDINRVAETAKFYGAGFIGVPASLPHNFQKSQMDATGVKYSVGSLAEITINTLINVDKDLENGTFWN